MFSKRTNSGCETPAVDVRLSDAERVKFRVEIGKQGDRIVGTVTKLAKSADGPSVIIHDLSC